VFDEAQQSNLAVANDPKAVLALDSAVVVLESNQQGSTDVAMLNIIDPASMTSTDRIPVSAGQAYAMATTPDKSQVFVAGRIDWNMVVVQRFTVSSGTLIPAGLWITQSTSIPTAIVASDRYVYVALRPIDNTTHQLFVLHNSQNGLFGLTTPISTPGQINDLLFVDNNDTHVLAGGAYSDGRGFITPVFFNGRLQARGLLRLPQAIQSLMSTGNVTKLRPELIIHAGSATMLNQIGYDILSNRFRMIAAFSQYGASAQVQIDDQIMLLATTPAPMLTLMRPILGGYQSFATANPSDWSITPLPHMTYLADALYVLASTTLHRIPLLP
jgi:hypothetical protein